MGCWHPLVQVRCRGLKGSVTIGRGIIPRAFGMWAGGYERLKIFTLGEAAR